MCHNWVVSNSILTMLNKLTALYVYHVLGNTTYFVYLKMLRDVDMIQKSMLAFSFRLVVCFYAKHHQDATYRKKKMRGLFFFYDVET